MNMSSTSIQSCLVGGLGCLKTCREQNSTWLVQHPLVLVWLDFTTRDNFKSIDPAYSNFRWCPYRKYCPFLRLLNTLYLGERPMQLRLPHVFDSVALPFLYQILLSHFCHHPW